MNNDNSHTHIRIVKNLLYIANHSNYTANILTNVAHLREKNDLK